MGMTGATSPTTIAGTLVQHVAENLSGLVIGQLAGRGAPVIFGGSPSSFDMRKGTTPMGAIETMMIDAAYAQIGKFLKLPTHAYMALSDAKVNDPQAGFETALGAVLGALAGVNVISGPGMLDLREQPEPGKAGHRRRHLRHGLPPARRHRPAGRPHRPGRVRGLRAGDVLPHPSPYPAVVQEGAHRRRARDRDTYEAWVAAGRTSIVDKAHADVARRLGKYAAPAARRGCPERARLASWAATAGLRAPAPGLPTLRERFAPAWLNPGPRSRGIPGPRPSSSVPGGPARPGSRPRPRRRG